MQRLCFIDTWVILQVFKRDADLLENWLVSRETVLHDGNLGDTIAQVEDLIRKHKHFEKTVQAQEEKFSALQRVTMVGSHFVCVCVLTTAAMLHCCSAKLACVQVCVCVCIFTKEFRQNVGKHIFLAL
jgi:hypothetical protein